MTTANLPCKVLVVDPCPQTQSSIACVVRRRGGDVMTASDPAAARASIDQAAPDIVITDLFLPDEGGLMLAQDVRRSHEFCSVIVTAADASEPAAVRAFRAGALDYLHKPIVEAELAGALARACHVRADQLADMAGVLQFEHRLTLGSDPVHVSRIVSWLLKTTAIMLSEAQRLRVRSALEELLINATEHGNLEIPYRQKRSALAHDRYESLLRERLEQPCLQARRVLIDVRYEHADNRLVYRIADEGAGFDWRSVVNRTADVADENGRSGRGIMLTRKLFPDLAYNDRGNEVTFTVPLHPNGQG
jgi:DNA-binding response OmpR family regulator